MAVKLIKPSNPRIMFYPKTASNAQTEGDFLYITSGKVSKVANANVGSVAGVCLYPVTSSSSDYTGTGKVPVLVDEQGIWEVGVDTATSFAPGVLCDLGGTNPQHSIACNESTYRTVGIVGGTTTRAHVVVRRWAHDDAGASVS